MLKIFRASPKKKNKDKKLLKFSASDSNLKRIISEKSATSESDTDSDNSNVKDINESVFSESDNISNEHLMPGNSKRNITETSPEQSVASSQAAKLVKTNNLRKSRSLNKIDDENRSRANSIQRRIPDYWLATSNKYEILEDNATGTEEENSKIEGKKVAIPKPPPIFVHGVGNINPLKQEIESTVTSGYTLKSYPGEKVKIILQTKDDYQAIITSLQDKKTEFHSFQLKEERAFRVILKGVHHKTEPNEIINALKEKGYQVMNAVPIKSMKTGNYLPMFYVNLKKNENNKSIYKIDRLINTVVSFESPHQKSNNEERDIPQCVRCQRFGHTKSYCQLGPRCVKCTGDHLAKDCPRKVKDDKVKCINCKGDHPANYKGCLTYQNIKAKLHGKLQEKIQKTQVKANEYVHPEVSYAQMAKKSENKTDSHSSDMEELKDMMKQLMNQLSTMLNLLTTVISKLK